MNKKTHNKRVNKKNKTKKKIKNNTKRNINRDIRIHRDIYSFDQEAGGLFDIFKKSSLKVRIKNFIKTNKLDTLIINKLIKENENIKNKFDIYLFKKYIYEFLHQILKKIYFLLKESKNYSLFKGGEAGKYNKYKYKNLYKYESSKLKNDKLLIIINSFIDLLFITKNTIYPLHSNSNHYLYQFHNYDNINKYFENNTISRESIKEYIKTIIEYDNTKYQRNKNAKLYFKKIDSQQPEIKYKKIQYIKSNENTDAGNNNIADTNKDKVFLIIYKNFSPSQKNNNSFEYSEDISENDFYILENNFVKIKNGISNYFKNMDSNNLTKKKTKYLIEDINKYFFNKQCIDNYSNFLLYYYKSQIFIE